MDTATMPRFRVAHRLFAWMQENGVKERIPHMEHVVLKNLKSVPEYARLVGRVPDMEDAILSDPHACLAYAGVVPRAELPVKVMDACGSDPSMLVRLAGRIHGRIPGHLESKIDSPHDYLGYVLETKERVPEMEERILFSDRFPVENCALAAAKMMDHLAGTWGGQDMTILKEERLLALVRCSAKSLEVYVDALNKRNMKADPAMCGAFKGNGDLLLKLATHLRGRLPEDLEDTWEGAETLVQYAIRFVRKRLPEHLEDRLVGNARACKDYAFQVVRGFSDPRLSDTLHTFMVMKSFESPEDDTIRQYVAECERIAGRR